MTYASSVTLDRSYKSQWARIALRALACAALIILVVGVSGCNKLKARDLLNKGVGAFKNGQYDAAIEFFKQSRDLDPTLMNARLYLATAYASMLPKRAAVVGQRDLGKHDLHVAELLELDVRAVAADVGSRTG